MYEITREGNRVVVKRSGMTGSPVLSTTPDAYLVYKTDTLGELQVSKVGDLTDVQLLLALARSVDLGPAKP